MKYGRMLGLLVLVATALLVLAASASATTVTNSSGGTKPSIDALNENAHVTLHNSFLAIECESTAAGTVSNEGGTNLTPSGNLTHLKFEPCTGGWTIDVESKGSLEIHYLEAGTGTHGVGTLTSSGATVTATGFGITCSYRTNATDIGKVTGGNTATLHIEATIPRHHGSFLCGGGSAAWTGNYVTNETLKIDP